MGWGFETVGTDTGPAAMFKIPFPAHYNFLGLTRDGNEKDEFTRPDHFDFQLDDYPLYNFNKPSATCFEAMTNRLKQYKMD